MSDARHMNQRILRLALPNILSNITVPLLGMVDMGLAGHLDDTEALGGIALSTTIFTILYWGFSFLRMGTTGLTAQALGERRHTALGRTLSQSVLIGMAVGVAILLLRDPLCRLTLDILKPEESVLPYVYTYFRIVVWGAPAMLCTYALNGWIIGMQNTWWPMVVSIVTNVVNIAISTTLVLQGEMGIEGIAIGTLTAQWVGVLMLAGGAYFLFLRRGDIPLALRVSELTTGIGKYFRTNVFIILRTLLLAVISVFFTSAGARMGVLPLAANALLYQFFSFFSYFIDGFAYAAEAIVGHSYGRKDRECVRRAIMWVVLWGFCIAVVVSVVYMVSGSSILHLLSDQPEVLAYAHDYLGWVYLLPLTGFVAFLMDGIFVGLTATVEMFVSMLIAVVVFFALYYGIPMSRPNDALWLAFDTYLLIRGVMQVVMLAGMRGVGRPFVSTYYISVGSTIIGEEEQIRETLRTHFPTGTLSSFHHSRDISGSSDRIYTNAVLSITTTLSVEELKKVTKEIEAEMGRDRTHPEEVSIDLDIVVRDGEVLRPKDYGREYFARGYRELRGEIRSVEQ